MLFLSKKKELRKMVKLKKTVFRQNILDQLNNLEVNNPKQCWKLVAELKELESSSSSNSDFVSVQEWINHFSKLLYNKNMVNCSELESFICNKSTAKTFTNLDYRITKDEIKNCISKLKSGKDVGMDRIPAEMIKISVDQLLPVYEKLFNSIFRKGIYPHNWKESFIVSLFKSGCRKDPSNYRGIAINSIFGKVFSMVLKNRIESFAKDNQVIDNTQIKIRNEIL